MALFERGLDSNRLAEPPASALLELDRERARPLALQAVGPDELAAAQRWLDRELPAIGVQPRGSLRFSCGNEHLWLRTAAATRARAAAGAPAEPVASSASTRPVTPAVARPAGGQREQAQDPPGDQLR